MAEQPHEPGTAEQPHTTGTAVPHGAEGKKVFPPLDPTTAAPLLVWLGLTFAVLYVLMSRFAIPRIGEVIEERRNRIQRDLDAAERLKGEVDQALASYEKALNDARTNASAIARETRDKLAAEVERERAAVEADNQTKLAAAEARISDTKRKALSSVSDIAADIAGPIVKQLIGKDVGSDEVKRALQTGEGK
ncbi:MAG: F0F1 ATP synthase subunit B [Hyphomicrobium sp.]|nr:F0F1 ATP synthase subunit B [Hyphomicrobium sp.]